ncbi:7821_t:CDS:10, partial [Racocetra fulgida]
RTNRIRKRYSLINLYLGKKGSITKGIPPGQKLCGNYDYVGKGGCREAEEIGKPAHSLSREKRLQEIERLDSKNYTAEEIATWEKCPPDIVEEFCRHEMGETVNTQNQTLTSSETTNEQIIKKEAELQKIKENKGGNSEEVRKLEQEIRELLLKNQQKNNTTTENSKNPNENKIIAYSIVGFSLVALVEQINLMQRDQAIRNYLYSLFPDTDRLKIEYTKNTIFIFLYIPEISLVLGEDNSKIETVMKGIYKIINDDKIAVKINLVEVKKVYTHAQSIANLIAGQLKKWIPVKQILKNVLAKVEFEREIKGGGVEMKGILNNTGIAQTLKRKWGKLPISTMDSNIEVGFQVAVLSRGTEKSDKKEIEIMSIPKKTKHRYYHLVKCEGLRAQRGAELTEKQIEAIRKVISVAWVRQRTIILELSEKVPRDIAYTALIQASHKLPGKYKVVEKYNTLLEAKNRKEYMNKDKEVKTKKPLSKEELLAQYRATLIVLRMKNKMGQLVKTHQIKELKKEIARILTKNGIHVPIMLKEVLDYLNLKKGGVYVDGTFGQGGHSQAILKNLEKGKLIAFE